MLMEARVGRKNRRRSPRRGRAASSKADSIVSALGNRVKVFRHQGGITLEQLAVQSGVSRAMLSKVERGEKSPTLSVVARIARGLNISLTTLLGAEPDEAEVAVIKAGKRQLFKDPETGFEREVLSPTHIDSGVELVLHRIPPGKSSGVLLPYNVPTEKYLVVHEGQLTVYINDTPHVLQTGDSMYFELKAPYRLVNEGNAPCAYYLAIVRKR